jgi:hypothetical protein
MELIPARSMQEAIYEQRNIIGPNESIYNDHRFSRNQMSHRPFEDGLATTGMHHTNSNLLNRQNCEALAKTIPNIMPYDIGLNYQMQYHKVPGFVQAACLPFSQ